MNVIPYFQLSVTFFPFPKPYTIPCRCNLSVFSCSSSVIKPGVSTEYLDDICNDYIVNTLQVIPANVGYHGFTKTTCISVNEEVCHAIPSAKKILQEGDILNIDVAVIKDGYFGSTSSRNDWCLYKARCFN